MKYKSVYLPGLNGLRAFAAILVVTSHVKLYLKEYNLDPFIFGTFKDGNPRGLPTGGYSSTIFFVISGFLITYLLQIEKEGKGTINTRKFYFRRILRIWPLYYLYLIISVLAMILFGLGLNVNSLYLYIFFAANIPFIIQRSLPLIAHYWTIGVIEQFYLFWPWIIKSTNSLLRVSMILIAILIGTKSALHFLYPDSIFEKAIHVTRFHCMLIGAAGCLLYKMGNQLFLKLIDNKITQIICWFVLFLVVCNKYHITSFIDQEIIAGITLFIIIGQIRIKNRIINLEQKVLEFISKISYGIYIIHPLIIFLLSKVLCDINIYMPIKFVLVYLIVLAVTILISYLSYNYFENYFLNFKKKFAVVKSSTTKSQLT